MVQTADDDQNPHKTKSSVRLCKIFTKGQGVKSAEYKEMLRVNKKHKNSLHLKDAQKVFKRKRKEEEETASNQGEKLAPRTQRSTLEDNFRF